MTSQFYEQLKSMYNLLSGDTEFEHLETIKSIQILNHARNWISGDNNGITLGEKSDIILGDINGWQNRISVSVDFEHSEKMVEKIRTMREQMHEGILEEFKLWQDDKEMLFDDWDKRYREDYGKVIIAVHENYILKCIKYEGGDKTIASDELIPPVYVTLRFHIKTEFLKAGVDEKHIDSKLIEYFTSDEFMELPVVKISSMLFASMARKAASGKKKLPSSGTFNDTEFISILLPYCDAMFIDKEFDTYLNEEPLKSSALNETKIFSQIRKEDFMEYFDDIESSASVAHLDEVRNVYGDDWPKPFREMYNS